MLPSFSASLSVGREEGDGALISDALQQPLSYVQLRTEYAAKSGNELQEGPSQMT